MPSPPRAEQLLGFFAVPKLMLLFLFDVIPSSTVLFNAQEPGPSWSLFNGEDACVLLVWSDRLFLLLVSFRFVLPFF